MGAPTQTKTAAVSECQLDVKRSMGAAFSQNFVEVSRRTQLCMQTKGWAYTWSGTCQAPSHGGTAYWCYRRRRIDEMISDFF
jgi:hypothetical protein